MVTTAVTPFAIEMILERNTEVLDRSLFGCSLLFFGIGFFKRLVHAVVTVGARRTFPVRSACFCGEAVYFVCGCDSTGCTTQVQRYGSEMAALDSELVSAQSSEGPVGGCKDEVLYYYCTVLLLCVALSNICKCTDRLL